MPPKRTSLTTRTAQDTRSSVTPDTPLVPTSSTTLWGEEPARQEVMALDVTQIMPNRRQPRTIFNQEALEELATSIREHGVLQPIIVRPIPLMKWEGRTRRYELIAGERRWRASILAEQLRIPALIREDASDHQTLIELALIENLQRTDLHPLEEARAFGVMRDELGYSYRKIAERVGRSKGYIQNRLKLLDLDDELQQLVLIRPDTLLHVVEVAKISDGAARAALIAAIRDNALSYPETHVRVRALLAPPIDVDTTSEVSLHEHASDQQHEDDHGDAAADEVYLHKYTPAQPPAGDQSDTTDDKVYLHKYTPAQPPAGDDGSATDDPNLITLSARERALLVGLVEKLEQWLDNPERLASADWEILGPLALRLGDLERRLDI